MQLLIETILVMIGTIAVVRFLHVNCAASIQWVAVPAVLVTAALVPAWIQKREFPHFGLRGRGVATPDVTSLASEPFCLRAESLPAPCLVAGTVGGVCLCLLPAIFLGLWVLTLLHLPVPLRPIVPERQGWLAWLLYQFFYVAVAEEVFFRGYVQANALRLLSRYSRLPKLGPPGTAIFISAACFALAHVIVQGQITPVLTFLPGLVLGWLFLRTGSLLAPILFHGLANVSYAVMAMTLAPS
jgi:membrane protease YdiL (CAAX protease family)